MPVAGAGRRRRRGRSPAGAGTPARRQVAAPRREHEARHVVAGDHVRVAGATGGQAVLADEAAGARRCRSCAVPPSSRSTTMSTEPDRMQNSSRRRLALLDDERAGREPLDVQVVGGEPEHRRPVGEQPQGVAEARRCRRIAARRTSASRPAGRPAAGPARGSGRAAARGGTASCSRAASVARRRRHVVGVAEAPVGAERDHHVGGEPLEDRRDRRDHSSNGSPGQLAVAEVEALDVGRPPGPPPRRGAP